MAEDYHPINVTAEEHTDPHLRKLARAFIQLTRLKLRTERLVAAVCEREPAITQGELHGWPCYKLNGQPFLVIQQTKPICRLSPRMERKILATSNSQPWYATSKTAPEPGWVVLSDSFSDEELLYWVRRAMGR